MLRIKKRLAVIGATVAAVTAGYAAPVAAITPTTPTPTASRTWVSGTGDDANPCSRTSPCKTFNGAISKTTAGGEIDCLDNAGYGGVGIDKSITIDCEATGGGVIIDNNGGIVVLDGNGSSPGTAKVVLRGIHFEGGGGFYGPGLEAIIFDSGASLSVEKCTIRNFTGDSGILFTPRTSAKLSVTDTSIINSGSANGAAITIKPKANAAFGNYAPIVSAVIANTSIVNSPNIGIQVSSATSDPTGTRTIVLVKDTVIYGGTYGATAIVQPGMRPIQLTISDSAISSNTGYGVAINGAGAQGRISNTVITGNSRGIIAQNGGAALSHGGNRLYANGTDGTFTATFAQQ